MQGKQGLQEQEDSRGRWVSERTVALARAKSRQQGQEGEHGAEVAARAAGAGGEQG